MIDRTLKQKPEVPKPKRWSMTAQQYLDWYMEQPDGKRYELVDGEPVMMAAERAKHVIVKHNAVVALQAAIKAKGLGCTAFADGMSVVIDNYAVYEPDAAVQCAPYDPDDVMLDEPLIVVDVLSPSTRDLDFRQKFTGYMQHPTIRHYLIVDADERLIILHSKTGTEKIDTRILKGGAFALDPPGLELSVESVFEGT